MDFLRFIEEVIEKRHISAFCKTVYIIACIVLFSAGFVIGHMICYILLICKYYK